MSKITIDNILASFASTTSINNRFNQIEDELNNKVLYRDNPVGEPNKMNNALDMNGFAILNASVLNVEDDSGTSIADGVSWAKEWAINPEDDLVSITAGGDGIDDYSSLHWANKASANATATAADVTATNDDVALTNADVATVAGIYDDFDDRYLGSKPSAPSLDNDGNALIDGAMYWKSTTPAMWVYDLGGTSWNLIGTAQNSAGSVTIADAGNYYAIDNVEAALQELGGSIYNVLPTIPVLTDSAGGTPLYITHFGKKNTVENQVTEYGHIILSGKGTLTSTESVIIQLEEEAATAASLSISLLSGLTGLPSGGSLSGRVVGLGGSVVGLQLQRWTGTAYTDILVSDISPNFQIEYISTYIT